MSKVKSWFEKAVSTLLDPERESQTEALVACIDRGIQLQRENFSLRSTLAGLTFSQQDLREAKERIYRALLHRWWSDGELNPLEQQTAKWFATRLELSPEQSRRLDVEQARKWFALTLAQAMEDGILTSDEETRLHSITNCIGYDLPSFARAFFQTEGEGFLRSIFLACIADNQISQSDWDYLETISKRS